jgi:hypothetical protein
MTNGLLISRQTKNLLYKAKVSVNSPENIENIENTKLPTLNAFGLQKNFILHKNSRPMQKIPKTVANFE